MTSQLTEDITGDLNPEQRAAVTAPLSDMLIIAGAGTGKTTVLARRLAYLVARYGIPPRRILAVTFTNKAAREMFARISRFVGARCDPREMWCGTFHGACCKILRYYHHLAGLPRDFKIIGAAEQTRIVRECCAELGLAKDNNHTPRDYAEQIARLKDAGLRPHDDVESACRLPRAADLYALYQTRCDRAGVLDFGELILRAVELLRRSEEVRGYMRGRFVQILVDEFQDTNAIQYEWLKLVSGPRSNSGPRGNVLIVGDDDQSIYGWRGAVANIMNRFSDDFPGARVYKLVRNYRSTGAILANANRLIGFSKTRFSDKELVTDRRDGVKAVVVACGNQNYEAEIIAKIIKNYKESRGCANGDFAVLYRTNMQSRAIEAAFAEARIPHRIVGGLRFYEREEIRNVMAYLGLVTNPDDDASLERIINVPSRKIGPVAVDKLKTLAAEHGITLFEACRLFAKSNPKKRNVADFVDLILSLRAALEGADGDAVNYVADLLDATGLTDYYREKDANENREDESRVSNIRELMEVISRFDPEDYGPDRDFPETDETGAPGEEAAPAGVKDVIGAFVRSAALDGNPDEVVFSDGGDSGGDDTQVSLMTIHSAKGLEFPCVIVAGFEDGLLPFGVRYCAYRSCLSSETDKKIDEERRLAYVAITRARNNLVLTYANERVLRGDVYSGGPSMFCDELDRDNLEFYEYGV